MSRPIRSLPEVPRRRDYGRTRGVSWIAACHVYAVEKRIGGVGSQEIAQRTAADMMSLDPK